MDMLAYACSCHGYYLFTGKQRWTGVDRQNEVIETQYNGILQNLGVSAPDGNDFVFFLAPGKSLSQFFL